MLKLVSMCSLELFCVVQGSVLHDVEKWPDETVIQRGKRDHTDPA